MLLSSFINVIFVIIINIILLVYITFLQVSYSPAGVAEEAIVENHFQLYPSENNLALALLAVVKEYGWRQLSILTQNEQPFIQVCVVYCSLKLI